MPSHVRAPLFWTSLAFAAGIIAGNRAWRPDPWWWLGFASALATSAYFVPRRTWLATALASMSVVCLGALDSAVSTSAPLSADLSRWCNGAEVMVTGHVIRDSTVRPPKFGKARQAVEVETEEMADEASAERTSAGVRVTLFGNPLSVPLLYGERIRFPARLRLPVNYRDPGAWDARSYLRNHGIVALATVNAAKLERLEGFYGSRLEFWRNRMRRALMSRTIALWGEQDAAVLYAMLIGQQSYIDRETRLDFQRTGTYHILVVSGMNVGILALVAFWALRRVRAGETVTTIVAVLVTGGYALLTDSGPPILRATLMLWIYLGARLLYRERAPLNAVGAAALVLMAADPTSLFDPSFQLTFLSVMAIAGIGVPLLERTSQPFRAALQYLDSVAYDARLEPRRAQFRLDLRMILERLYPIVGRRLARWVLLGIVRSTISTFDLVVIAALMQAALALPMAMYFHRAAILALPANSMVVPLATVLMPLAIMAVLLSYAWMGLASVAVSATGVVLHAIRAVVHALGGWSAAEVRVATPSMECAVAAAVAFGLALLLVRRRASLMIAGLAALVASATWITAIPPREQVRPGVLEVTSLDVGQGDAHFLITPNGSKLLLDSGGIPGGDPRTSFDVGEDVVSPYLWSRGIGRLDVVALSHAHSDHIGGLAAVIANFRPRELWIGAEPNVGSMEEVLHIANANGVRVVRRAAGERFEFGGARIEVLSPPVEWDTSGTPSNDDSMVLRVQYGESAVLMAGDVEKRSERRLAALAPSRPAEGGAPRQRDLYPGGVPGCRPPQVWGDLLRAQKCVRISEARGTRTSERRQRANVPNGRLRGCNFLPGRQKRATYAAESSVTSSSEPSSVGGEDVRYSSIRRRASSARSWLTRTSTPPTPGRTS